jgi:phage baseplate assembly protein W
MQSAVRAGLSPPAVDLRLTSEKSALAQALIMRLMTERGELAGLGHPEYGSRHHALVGEPNNEANRNLIKLYMLECLRQEPRLDRIVQLDVKPGEGRENRDKVDVRIVVKFKALPDALILVLPFSFKGPLE